MLLKKKAFFLFFLLLGSLALYAKPTADLLSFGGGIHDIIRDEYRTGEFRVEYKSHLEWYLLRPMVGITVTAKGAVYSYLGVGLDWVLQDHFILSPNFAAGYYHHGGDKDLGFPLEFRSGIELGWQFSSLYRVGVHFYHVSNAHLGHKNPGEESLVLFFSIPIKNNNRQK
jgi:lipid A 3-O-deacylase